MTNPTPTLSTLTREALTRWAAELTSASAELATLGETAQRVRARVVTVTNQIAVTVARLEDGGGR